MKAYLGDSVYVDTEHGMLKLTTENGLGPSNTIFMEPEVLDALLKWLAAENIVTTGELERELAAAIKATAQECVEICHSKKSTAKGRAWIEVASDECAQAIKERFLK